MQKILTLLSTALVVSLDSFVAGFSVSINKRKNISLPATVALCTFVMCLLSTLVGMALRNVLDAYIDSFSAIILVTLATINLLKCDEDSVTMQPPALAECAAIGVAVGMDACVANLSLSVEGYGIIAPIVFAVTHYFTVWLGQTMAGKVYIKYSNIFSAAVLFTLAAVRII